MVACSSTRNVEQRRQAAGIAGAPATEPEALPTCVNTCAPDPLLDEYIEDPTSDKAGILADCAEAEKDTELYPGSFMDMEDQDGGVFRASNFYSYDDKSSFALNPSGWQPWGIEMRRCREDKATYDQPAETVEEKEQRNHVLHITGGPFLDWGGGIGRHLKCFNRNPNGISDFRTLTDLENGRRSRADDKACGFAPSVFPCDLDSDDLVNSICPERDMRELRGEEVPPEEEFLIGAALDFSKWDGISFWARRSPNSQTGIRVAIGDKYVEDDLRWLQAHVSPDQEPFCKIKRECHCPDATTTCTLLPFHAKTNNAGPDPEANATLGGWTRGTPVPTEVPLVDKQWFCATPEDQKRGFVLEINATRCASSACDYYHETWQKADVNFYGKPCTEYALRGSIVEAYCFDPETDPPPPEEMEICGDHWMKPIQLSTEWRFYKVPFTSLLQQGWAMESHQLDLTSVAVLRFTWDRGYIDYWLDDLRLYRDTR